MRSLVLLLGLFGCGRLGFEPSERSQVIDSITTNIAFVTSTAQPPGELGGLAGADALCNERARDGGLPGTYVAWLSSSSANARDRLGTARGWARPDGRPFADTLNDLVTSDQLRFPLRIDELGNDLGALPIAERVVATGTVGGAVTSGATCSDFMSVSGNVNAGYLDATRGAWTTAASGTGADVACSTPMRLYCFGVDRDVPLSASIEVGRLAFATYAGWPPGTGLVGADAHCQSAADSAGVVGTFRALMSTATASAASRFDLSRPNWVRVDGTPVAESPAALMRGELLTTLGMTATGGQPGYSGVWTGAAGDGTSAPDTVPALDKSCANWTDYYGAGGGGMGYDFHSGPEFFDRAAIGCTTVAAVLYCLEE